MKIISDTTCHFTVEEASQANIILVPNQVSVGDRNYRDYLDISSAMFIDEIMEAHPQTSQPSVGDVMQAYENCCGEETIHITTGKGLSSAFESACAVKTSMVAEYVTVFNSASVVGPNRYLVQLAVRLASTSHSVQQIVDRLTTCSKDSQSFVIPVDFGFLKRSGRLTPLAATLGGFLHLKPIMCLSEDRQRIEKFSVARTWVGAVNMIIDDLVKHGVCDKHRIYVSHAYNMEATKIAVDSIQRRIQNSDIEILNLAPSMITHGGPGCLVIQYILKDEEA